MKFQIDDIKKTIVFESAEALSISVINVFLGQLDSMYPDIYEWETSVVEKLNISEKVVGKKKVPEKPKEPPFDFTQNTLSKEENQEE